MRARALVFAALLLAGAWLTRPPSASAQLTASDSAAVLLDAARAFEAGGRWEVAEALYRHIVERHGLTAAAAARARLAAPPLDVVYGSGRVELQVWMTLYGSWLGIAVPGAFGAESSEPYGVGLLFGRPTGFLVGRSLARSLNLTEGQARAITLGGSWGTWQGFGWREVLDLGTDEVCDTYPDGMFCYEEDSGEETFAAMVLGGLAGIAAGAALSGRDITPGTGTTVNFGALWGTWFGVASGVLLDLEDDRLLAATLLGGNAGLAATAVLAPSWNVSRSRARLVSIAGVIGGLAGAGIDLLTQPESEKVAIGIPLATSIVGLAIGIHATRVPEAGRPSGLEASSRGALPEPQGGRLRWSAPSLSPVLVPREGPDGTRWRPALKLELVRASF